MWILKFRSLNLQGDIRLVDFNPFCAKTDSLLFSWEELVSGSGTSEGETPAINPVIRVVEDNGAIRPHDLQEYRYPQVSWACVSGLMTICARVHRVYTGCS